MNIRHQIINAWAHLMALDHSNFYKIVICTSWPYNVTVGLWVVYHLFKTSKYIWWHSSALVNGLCWIYFMLTQNINKTPISHHNERKYKSDSLVWSWIHYNIISIKMDNTPLEIYIFGRNILSMVDNFDVRENEMLPFFVQNYHNNNKYCGQHRTAGSNSRRTSD